MSNDDPLLNAALRGIAEEDERARASAAVAARLRAAFHATSLEQRRARARRYGVMLAAAAAVLVTAIAVRSGWSSRDANSPVGGSSDLPAREIVTEFMPLTYSDVPFSAGQLVRLQVPRTALASFG